MLILGFNGGNKFEDEEDPVVTFHDSAAVLLRDGEILAGIEEERLSRIKHSNCFPARAIRYCLESCNCTFKDLDVIATNNSQFHKDLHAKMEFMEDPASKVPVDGREYVALLFRRAFGVDVADRVYFCDHHLSHAWSAYALSGFDESLVLSVDGEGDSKSGLILTAQGKQMNKLREFKVSESVGILYENLIRILGYGRFDEYKVMGLAPYGDPGRFRSGFEQCYKLLPGGEYHIEPLTTWFGFLDAAGILKQARRKGEPFLQIHKDFAAAMQEVVERLVLHILQGFRKKTGQKRLCLAGGVAHNCTMNGKILNSGMFEEVFVQPAAHDAGGSLGAALGAWHNSGNAAGWKAKALSHLYWGTHIGADASIEKKLQLWSPFVTYALKPSIAQEAASLIAAGEVLGWVQGRSEFGPRALGNRSIVADPRPNSNKLRINEMIKKREQYRPFAPSILEERVSDFFEVTAKQTEFPFMIFVLEVQKHARELLGATTHVDGTARVQSVSWNTNPLYWELIKEFENLTGIPVLLNTSMNNHAEPIVDSVDDAVGCFLTTGLSGLAIGNYLVRKRSPEEVSNAGWTLIPKVPLSRKLVKRTKSDWVSGEELLSFGIESMKCHYFGPRAYDISPHMFTILEQADGVADFGTLAARNGIPSEKLPALLSEITELWSQRIIHVLPGSVDAKSEIGQLDVSLIRA